MANRDLYPGEEILVNTLLNILYLHGFKEGDIPCVQEDDSNCLLRRTEIKKINDTKKNDIDHTDDKELYDIDELLGLYDSKGEKPLIILYTKCIEECAKKLEVDKRDLQYVVLLHEIGHWITHKLPYEEQSEWNNFGESIENRDVLEGWAQLLTWWVVKDIPKLRSTFLKLNYNQSNTYKIWMKYEDASVMALLLLRECDCSVVTTKHWEDCNELINSHFNSSFEELKMTRRGACLGMDLGVV